MKGYSLRSAINRKCKECIYDNLWGEGTWREQVTKCTVTDCALYPVRPIDQNEKNRRKGIKK